MSANCDHCGYRDNEVKSGGAISEKGRKMTLKVEDAEDLARDILKVGIPYQTPRAEADLNLCNRARAVDLRYQRLNWCSSLERSEVGSAPWKVCSPKCTRS